MKLIAAVIITAMSLIAIMLAVLNAESVNINYYFGESSHPLSLLIVIALASGVFLGIVASLVVILKLKAVNARLKKDIKVSEKELVNLRRLPLRDMD